MRRFIQLVLRLWFAISMTLAQVCVSAAQIGSTYSGSGTTDAGAYSAGSSGSHFATSYRAEQNESRALTDYLKQRKLPLVGAQVLRGAEGQRMVVLYGFVGSDFGKADAEKKSRIFLHDSTVVVDNRINVRPELLVSNGPTGAAVDNPDSSYRPEARPSSNSEGSSSSADSSAYPGPESYRAQQANPYAQQLTSMMPLIALLGALGMSMAGGSSGFSFGTSPLGGPSYRNPYSSPYGPSASPYGSSPFGGSPYGGSPYGRYPYGSSPYGNPPYGSVPNQYP
jgi:hypothetical protein